MRMIIAIALFVGFCVYMVEADTTDQCLSCKDHPVSDSGFVDRR